MVGDVLFPDQIEISLVDVAVVAHIRYADLSLVLGTHQERQRPFVNHALVARVSPCPLVAFRHRRQQDATRLENTPNLAETREERNFISLISAAMFEHLVSVDLIELVTFQRLPRNSVQVP